MAPATVEGAVALPSPQKAARPHARSDTFLHHQTGLGGEFHRWNDETVGVGHERPFAPFILAARNQMQQLHCRFDVARVGEGGTDVLLGARAAGVDGVEVHLQIVGNIAAHHRALHEVDIVQCVADPGGVMQILHGAITIVAAVDVDHMHGSVAVP